MFRIFHLYINIRRIKKSLLYNIVLDKILVRLKTRLDNLYIANVMQNTFMNHHHSYLWNYAPSSCTDCCFDYRINYLIFRA